MNREPEDAIDYEYQHKYGADYKEHLHEINSEYLKIRKVIHPGADDFFL